MEQKQLDKEISDLLQRFSSLSNDEIIALFDPKEAETIPVEVLSLMPSLTNEQILLLGNAYPNNALNTAYLILKDKDFKGKPLYPRSTWANLADLRRAGLKNWYALTYTKRWKGDDTSMESVLAVAPVQDLTKDDVAKAAGLNTGGLQVAAPQTSEAVNDGTKSQEAQQQPQTGQPNTSTQEGTNEAKTGENTAGQNEEFPDLKNEAALQAEQTQTSDANQQAGVKDEAAKASETSTKTVTTGRNRNR